VKAIALHGLGLYIYAGEDLPSEEQQLPKAPITPTTGAKEALTKEQIEKVDRVASGMLDMFEDGMHVSEPYAVMDNAGLDNEERIYLWTWLDSKQRAALKKHHESLKKGKA